LFENKIVQLQPRLRLGLQSLGLARKDSLLLLMNSLEIALH
jgi:hypothetical protein